MNAPEFSADTRESSTADSSGDWKMLRILTPSHLVEKLALAVLSYPALDHLVVTDDVRVAKERKKNGVAYQADFDLRALMELHVPSRCVADCIKAIREKAGQCKLEISVTPLVTVYDIRDADEIMPADDVSE